MNNQSFWFFEDVDVSGIFCPQKITNTRSTHIHRTFNKGDYVFMPEEDANKIYFIMEGRVKIGMFSNGGKEITKAVLTDGEVFGELALLTDDKRRDFALAMEKTTVCVIVKSDLKSLLREHSGLSLFLMKVLGNRTLEMEQRLANLVFKDSRTRIV